MALRIITIETPIEYLSFEENQCQSTTWEALGVDTGIIRPARYSQCDAQDPGSHLLSGEIRDQDSIQARHGRPLKTGASGAGHITC